ncbi:MAG TPA: exo-alpha-sialidase [Saprospiraceae bacterium]|nr:exo-alpha-sialidase [Saprospiraceae bacterium]
MAAILYKLSTGNLIPLYIFEYRQQITESTMFKNLILIILSIPPMLALSQSHYGPEPVFDFLTRFDHVRDFCLNPTQDEAYFTIQSPNEEIAVIVFSKKTNGQWVEPKLTSFTGTYRDIEPFITPDGLRLFFSSNRPLVKGDAPKADYDIWYVKREINNGPWSEPIHLEGPVNTLHNEFYPFLSKNGNLYFTSDANHESSKDDIYYSAWGGKAYGKPILLDQQINSPGYEFNAYISPDEDMLIFTAYNRSGGMGSGDLYLSRKDSLGHWTSSYNLGNTINSKYMDYCPFWDAANQLLYFTSKRSTVTPKTFLSLLAFEQVAGQYENGLSRLYKVAFIPPEGSGLAK